MTRIQAILVAMEILLAEAKAEAERIIAEAGVERKQVLEGLAETQQEETIKQAGERMVLTIIDVEYAFRWCPSGTFLMGSPADETAERSNWETRHRVTLSKGFWILETQVTQEMWESIMEDNPSNWKGKKLPVEQVSWYDCQEFIRQLNALNVSPVGYQFSLPTEEQWEYACRAGTTTVYHFGNRLTRQQANFNSNVGKTTEVGSYPMNAWGLHDMHGNVYEWCSDLYGEYPDNVTDRVLRGGCFDSEPWDCRSAFRFGGDPWDQYEFMGIRLSLVCDE